MNNLLSANLMRLKKSWIFWGTVVLMAGLGCFFAVMQKKALENGVEASLERGLFQFVAVIGIMAAVFCAIFVGTEYSDGTIRNKVIAGYDRLAIYLSMLVTCSMATAVLCLICMLCYTMLGAVLVGWFTLGPAQLLGLGAAVLVLVVCFSSMFTLIAMLCHNKAASAVACILVALLLLFIGSHINTKLEEPKTYGGYLMDETGAFQEADPTPNPAYVAGTTRKVYEFLFDVTPGGQQMQLSSMACDQPWHFAGYSAVITVMITACGSFAFRKKDLK